MHKLADPDGWRTVREDIEVKLTRHPQTTETVILCRSAERRSKERAIHDKFSQRIEAALQRLAARIVAAGKSATPWSWRSPASCSSRCGGSSPRTMYRRG